MNPVEQLNLTIWSWIETFRSMRKGVTFAPFLLYLGAQAVLFAMLWGFSHPAVSWVMAPLLVRGFGEGATHYPNNFAVFPVFFARADLPLQVLVGAFVFGAGTWLFARFMAGGSGTLAESLSNARSRYFTLVLAQLPGTLLGAAILYFSEHQAAASDLHGNALRLMRYGGLFAAIAAQALFAFTLVIVMYEGAGIGRALGGSLRLASRNAIGSFLLIALPVVLHYPALLAFRQGQVMLQRGAPEVIAGITGLDLLVGVLTNYLVMGAVTRFYLARRRSTSGGSPR